MDILKRFIKKFNKLMGKYQDNLPIPPDNIFRDFDYCPKCESQNISRVYIIPTSRKIYVKSKHLDRCLNCSYEDEIGQFELSNKMTIRNKKIEEILKK
jgi:hypothetical protein